MHYELYTFKCAYHEGCIVSVAERLCYKMVIIVAERLCYMTPYLNVKHNESGTRPRIVNLINRRVLNHVLCLILSRYGFVTSPS